MISRLVKLSFELEKVKDFLLLFEKTYPAIAAFQGCRGVKLLRDIEHPHICFTYSLWESASALENYRQSELFQTTWAQTKQWFNEKPAAWSLNEETFHVV